MKYFKYFNLKNHREKHLPEKLNLKKELTFIKNAIKRDDLPQERFIIYNNSITNTLKYKKTMMEISNISQVMKWILNYDDYPTRKFEYPYSFYATSLDSKMKLLDVGCSTDPFSPFLANKGFLVFGVDNFKSHDVQWDPEHGLFKGNLRGMDRMKVYNKFLKRRLNISVNYYNEDMCSTHFSNNYFDRIFCISVLEHLPDYKIKITFDEWRRILKKNGYVILTMDYIVNGKPRFNIGKLLNEVGFILIDKVNIFYINEYHAIVVGLVVKSSKRNISKISKLYRRSSAIRFSIDRLYNRMIQIKKMCNKFLNRIILKKK